MEHGNNLLLSLNLPPNWAGIACPMRQIEGLKHVLRRRCRAGVRLLLGVDALRTLDPDLQRGASWVRA